MKPQTRIGLIGALVALIFAQAHLQGFLDPTPTRNFERDERGRLKNTRTLDRIDELWKANYAPKGQNLTAGLSPEQLLVAIGGLREFIAGILWVRADGFFHTGNYDAILPMTRIVTWLDPHQRDVYSTGAWHMAYNFTDEQQRSDRRYIAPALALLEEGVRNNPNTYELYFESGWMYYNKIEDHFDRSANWFARSWQLPDIIDARRNMLAHAYEHNGQVNTAIETWYDVWELAETALQRNPQEHTNRTNRDVTENNLDLTIIRSIARKYDTQPPIDVQFGVRVTVPEPKKIRVIGRLGIPALGPRVRAILKDAGYKLPDPGKEFTFEVPTSVTYMQDSLYVRNTRFDREIDMSRDPAMYTFKADSYDLVFMWNPRLAAPHIQDRIGYNGEGITDKRFVHDGYKITGQPRPSPDAKWNIVYAELKLTRDQILRRGEWADKMPVVQTPGFVPPPQETRR